MKTTFYMIAVVTALTACSEKPATPVAAPSAPAPVPAVVAPTATLVMPTDVRPTQIPATLTPTDQCSVDRVNGAAAAASLPISDRAPLTLHGWAAHVPSGSLPKLVYVEMVGANTRYVQATLGSDRSDVAEIFKKPSLTNAGWDVLTNVAGMTPGTYALRVIQVHADNTGTVCDSLKALVLSANRS